MCKASERGPCGISGDYERLWSLPRAPMMTWLVQVLVRTRGIRLLLPHVQFLLTLSQGTEPGISTLAAGGMAADPACLSLWHDPGPVKSPYSVTMPGFLAPKWLIHLEGAFRKDLEGSLISERRPARALSGVLKRRATDDGRGTDMDMPGV